MLLVEEKVIKNPVDQQAEMALEVLLIVTVHQIAPEQTEMRVDSWA